jgi:hypothetical protein
MEKKWLRGLGILLGLFLTSCATTAPQFFSSEVYVSQRDRIVAHNTAKIEKSKTEILDEQLIRERVKARQELIIKDIKEGKTGNAILAKGFVVVLINEDVYYNRSVLVTKRDGINSGHSWTYEILRHNFLEIDLPEIGEYDIISNNENSSYINGRGVIRVKSDPYFYFGRTKKYYFGAKILKSS